MKYFKTQLIAVLMSVALFPFAGTAAAGTQIGTGPLGAGTHTATSEIFLDDFTDDTWTFSLAQASDVTVSLASVDQTVFAFVLGLDSVTGELSGGSGQFFTVLNLAADNTYSLLVDGIIGADLDGGSYTVSLNVAAVPLPAAAWLFGSAILGLTVVARRRNSQRSGIAA